MGASGYAGGELLRLLTAHPAVAVGPLFGAASAGQRVGTIHRHLSELADTQIGSLDALLNEPARQLAGVDILFLALPHGHSGAVVRALDEALAEPDAPVIVDLGADHRLSSAADWAKYYASQAGGEANRPYAGAWVYGLPELAGARPAISSSRRIANPGCYPTGVALGLAPLLAAGVGEPKDAVVVAASGTTGAGRSAAAHLSGSEVMGSLAAYKAGGAHQHTPEMAQSLSRAANQSVSVSFTPFLAPMPRGILATSSLPVAPQRAGEARSALVDAYDGEPFVQVLPEGVWPRTADVVGSNAVHLQVAVDEVAGRVVVVSALDNLVKGAAGQAIQNANVALGLPETTGLTADGFAP